MAKAALEHLKEGAAIVNTTSVTAYKGNVELIDYAATKGAIVSFTRSLSHALVEKKIRVNAVAKQGVEDGGRRIAGYPFSTDWPVW